MGTPVVNPNGAQLGQSRVFTQLNPSPTSPVNYQGCATIGEAEQDLGDVEPIYCPSPSQYNKWDIVDTKRSAPALGSNDVTVRMSRDGRDWLRDVAEQGCPFNVYQKWACAGRPDDFRSYDYIDLFEYNFLTSLTTPMSNPLSGDDNDAANLTGSITWQTRTRILKLTFGEKADSVVVGEVLDGFYYDAISCGVCSPSSDGCQKCYMLTVNSGGSPGLSSQIVYTGNAWSTAATMDIPVLGGLSANRAAPVGQFLVVVSQANLGHAYAAFTDIDAGTVNWTLVTSGYVSTKGPRAIWSKNPSQTYIAAAGGYIYLLTDAASAVTVLTDGSVSTQQLNDIHGVGDVVVAVGNSNAVLFSTNAGLTFGSVTGPAVGVTLTSVWVQNNNTWFVSTGTGLLYVTQNSGVSWTQISLPSLGAVRIYDGCSHEVVAP